MRKDKNIAIRLRRSGKSYGQIRTALGIPKSTLSVWLRDVKLSQESRRRILSRGHEKSIIALIKRNKYQTVLANKRAGEARDVARAEVRGLMDNPLFISGVALYWAEGYKKGASGSKWKSFDFTNSDPEMVMVMMRFLDKVCKINKKDIKIQLMIHSNSEAERALRYWVGLTGVPRKQFIKTCNSLSKYSRKKRKPLLTNGTIHIRINNVKFFFKIIGWIDGLKDSLGL